MSEQEERIQITIEQELDFVRQRLDFATQLLTFVVAKYDGEVILTPEDLEADVSGVSLEDLEDGGFKVIAFKDEDAS